MKHTLRCHGFGELGQVVRFGPATCMRRSPITVPKPRPALKGLRPESPLALSLGSPIREVLVSPRFAPSTILPRNARAFHHVTGSTVRYSSFSRHASAAHHKTKTPPKRGFYVYDATSVGEILPVLDGHLDPVVNDIGFGWERAVAARLGDTHTVVDRV